jgi:hypothetical protein
MLPHLMPAFKEAFPRLHGEFRHDQRDRFGGYLAGIACHSGINPLDDWLTRFLISTGPEERRSWAFAMVSVLRSMKEAAAQNAWSSWIRTYWDKRIEGIPLPLHEEVSGMIQWALYFKTSFAEVTDTMSVLDFRESATQP